MIKILAPLFKAIKSCYALENSGLGWNVSVNGISVGIISKQDMDKIYSSVRQDKRVWLAQGFQSVKAAINAVTAAFKLTPFALFGYAIVAAYVEPVKFNHELTTDPAQLFLVGTFISFVVSCFAMLFSAMFTDNMFGFRDQFAQKRARLMRVMLNVPADGEVSFIDQGYIDHYGKRLNS
ncbi:hypothetical protein ACSSUR_28195 [Pseudomonas cedrina]|uniref:hypothetical protein n=1 Tax=Pseudomonas cedrina TaxID=651740 RepID=UPI003ED9BF2B